MMYPAQRASGSKGKGGEWGGGRVGGGWGRYSGWGGGREGQRWEGGVGEGGEGGEGDERKRERTGKERQSRAIIARSYFLRALMRCVALMVEGGISGVFSPRWERHASPLLNISVVCALLSPRTTLLVRLFSSPLLSHRLSLHPLSAPPPIYLSPLKSSNRTLPPHPPPSRNPPAPNLCVSISLEIL